MVSFAPLPLGGSSTTASPVGSLSLRQGEPHFSFAQLFFDLVEEGAALEASIAHRKSQGAIEARIIQAQERIERCEAR